MDAVAALLDLIIHLIDFPFYLGNRVGEVDIGGGKLDVEAHNNLANAWSIRARESNGVESLR